MKNFKFNKIIVLESLPDNEEHTGKELYDDLLKRMSYIHKGIDVEYKDIDSLSQWDEVMSDILLDCCMNSNIPILHFELHGDTQGKGIVTKNLELISIRHVGEQLRLINIATGCNLFITLGVCKGLNLLLNMTMSDPMPFIGVIGSFDNLLNTDIYIRFYDFYDKFFTTFDIAKSYIALQTANPDLPSNYRYIPADELFYKNYQVCLDTQCTDSALRERAKQTINANYAGNTNRAQRRKLEQEFIKLEKKKRPKSFREHTSIFFMLNDFPGNKDRFNVPSNFKELKERYDKIVMLHK